MKWNVATRANFFTFQKFRHLAFRKIMRNVRAAPNLISNHSSWFDHFNIILFELQNLAGRKGEYGPLNWPITARVLTKWYNKLCYNFFN